MASILKVYYKTCFTTGFIIGAYHGHIERMKRLNTDINIFETTPSLIRDGVIGGIISIILLLLEQRKTVTYQHKIFLIKEYRHNKKRPLRETLL